MNRQQWKDSLEGMGIIAIIASLAFVGIETRNSTEQAILTNRALEISAYQDLMTNIEELNTLALQDDNVALAMSTYWGNDGGLERSRELRAFFLLIRHADMAFYMYQRGAIDENRLRSSLGPIQFEIQQFRDHWATYKVSFAREFQEYIDDRIAASGTSNSSQ